MIKETIEVYVCQYCGAKHIDESFMGMHEEVCPKNPKNQPCSECENQILGVGCSKNVDMESICGNAICFCYKKGQPKNILNMMGEEE